MFLNWMPLHLFVLSFKTCILTVTNVIFFLLSKSLTDQCLMEFNMYILF